MPSYSYDKILNFVNGIKPMQLHKEIKGNSSITKTLIGINMNNSYVNIEFDKNLTVDEKTILDTIISHHNPVTVEIVSSTIKVNPIVREINTVTHQKVDSFIYEGSDAVGKISKIIVLSNVDSGTYCIRIFDKTNGQVVAANGFSNTVEDIVDLGHILWCPPQQAVLEIQVKRIGGKASSYVHVSSVVFNLKK